MLAIPPKMQNALDMGNFEPVKTVKIVTSVLDAPVSGQTFVDINANLANIVAKRDIEQAYPDPAITSVFKRSGFDGQLQGLAIGNDFGISPFQTFTLGEDIQQGSTLDTIKITLQRNGSSTGLNYVSLSVFDAESMDELVNKLTRFWTGQPASISPISDWLDISTVPEYPNPASDFTFPLRGVDGTSLVSLIPGRRYAIVPRYFENPLGSSPSVRPTIHWFGSPGLVDISTPNGVVSPTGGLIGSFDGILSHEITIRTYDSTPTPTLQIQYDMGETPDKVGHWSIQDSPAAMIDAVSGDRQETSISYNAWAGDSLGAKTINLGAIDPSDVASLAISTFRRYYVLEAVFTATANGLRTHRFVAANPVFPKDSIIISNKTLPFADVVALNSTTSTSTQLDIKTRLSEIGEFSFQVFDIDDVILRYLLQSHLLNLPIEYRMGHHPNATSENDLLLLFSGKLSDSPKLQKGLLFFKAKDYSTNLDVKIPRVDPRNLIVDRTKVRRTTKGDTHVNAMLKIFGPEARIQSRYLRKSTFAALETKLLADDVKTLWISAKDFTKETEAKKEIQFLLEITGSYLVPQEDGVLNIVIFPRLDTSVASWDGKILYVGDVQKSGWAQTIVNLCFVEFDLYGDGKLSGLAGKNDLASQNALAPGAGQHLADRVIQTGGYLGSEAIYNGQTLGERVSKREVDHKSLGIIPYSCVTGLDQIAVQIGDYVDITTEAHLKKGLSGAINVQFMPIKKTINDDRGEISWDLAEVINIGELPTAVFTATPTSGLPTLNVQVDATLSHDNNPGGSLTYEWDFDSDGVNFQPDATRTTAIPAPFAYTTTSVGIKRIALRVTNGLGGQHIITTGQVGQPTDIRVFGPPVAVIDTDFANPNSPSIAQLSSASYGVVGEVVLTEWDIGYNGTTFLTDQTGESISVPLLSVSLTIGLRVTDENGLSAISTIALPASVNAITPGVDISSLLTTQWTKQANPKTVGIQAIAWSKSLGLFCAVGVADGTDAYIITSPDGQAPWTEQANPKNVALRAIDWSKSLGLFCAVGDSDGTDAYIITSPDGQAPWTEQANPKNVVLNGIAWSESLGLFCAVGQPDGTDAYIITSPNGQAPWTEQANPKNVTLFEIAWSESLGLFCAVGDFDIGDAYIITSPDGQAPWTEQANPKNIRLLGVDWSESLGLFCAVGGFVANQGYIITSPDGQAPWTEQVVPKNVNLKSIIWNGYIFLIAGGQLNQTFVAGSKDGKKWFTRETGVVSSDFFRTVTWNNSIFICAGDGGVIATSLSMIS